VILSKTHIQQPDVKIISIHLNTVRMYEDLDLILKPYNTRNNLPVIVQRKFEQEKIPSYEISRDEEEELLDIDDTLSCRCSRIDLK
jgi:hypothetical protein